MLIDNLPESVNVAVAVAGGLFGWLFLSQYVVNQIGILYAVVGGALVAGRARPSSSGRHHRHTRRVSGVHVYIDSKSANEVACDLSDYNTYIAIAIALVVVYFGLREGGSSKGDAPSETDTAPATPKGQSQGWQEGQQVIVYVQQNERRNEKDCNFTRYSLSKRLDEM